jgi:TetR/AcrR family transcriptional repressor of nem operon
LKKSSRDRLLDATFEECYLYGYSGASTTRILKRAKLPRGSLYHHFKNRDDLIYSMVEERLKPKVRNFFRFDIKKSSSVIKELERLIEKMSDDDMLLAYGCPLHRLIVESRYMNVELAISCKEEYDRLFKGMKKLMKHGIKKGEIVDKDPKDLARFFISSTWGILSRDIKKLSKKRFLRDMSTLLTFLKKI